MARTTGYTLPQAREELEDWKACKRALAKGQVKSYRIGTRELTMLELEEINEEIQRMANIVASLEGNGRTTRVVRVIPRDL